MKYEIAPENRKKNGAHNNTLTTTKDRQFDAVSRTNRISRLDGSRDSDWPRAKSREWPTRHILSADFSARSMVDLLRWRTPNQPSFHDRNPDQPLAIAGLTMFIFPTLPPYKYERLELGEELNKTPDESLRQSVEGSAIDSYRGQELVAETGVRSVLDLIGPQVHILDNGWNYAIIDLNSRKRSIKVRPSATRTIS